MGTSPRTGLVTQPTQPEFFNQLQRSGYSSTSSSLICADKLAAAQHMCSRVPLSSSVLEPMPLRDGIPSIVWALYGMTSCTRVDSGTTDGGLYEFIVVQFRKESSPMSCCQAAQFVPEVSERMTIVPTTLALFTMKLRVIAPPE